MIIPSFKSFAFYEFVKLFMTDRFWITHFIRVSAFLKNFLIFEMEYDNMSVIDLKALVKEHGLRGYSKLRKAELITFLQNNLQTTPAL